MKPNFTPSTDGGSGPHRGADGEPWPSVEETMRVMEGVLGPDPGRFLSAQVELVEAVSERTYSGRSEVIERLTHVQALFDPTDLRLSANEGRGIAEWAFRSGGSSVAMVCVFEIKADQVWRARLYYDPKAVEGVQRKEEV